MTKMALTDHWGNSTGTIGSPYGKKENRSLPHAIQKISFKGAIIKS